MRGVQRWTLFCFEENVVMAWWISYGRRFRMRTIEKVGICDDFGGWMFVMLAVYDIGRLGII